jgi:uncharacterized protein (TIGR00251 family)
MSSMLRITVIPNARTYKVKRRDDGIKVYVKSKALEGEANKDLLSFLSPYMKTPRIIAGHKSRKKIISVENEKGEVDDIVKMLVEKYC